MKPAHINGTSSSETEHKQYSINFSRRKHRSDYRLSNQRGELYSNIPNCARLQLRYFDTACAHVNTNFAKIYKHAKKMQ